MKKLISLLAVLSIIFGTAVTSYASSYYDVADDAYYAESVEALSLYGVISGYAGYFDPDATITRAEFAKIASIVGGLEDEAPGNAGNKKFNDVDVTYWGNGYINTVANNQLIVGYPNGSFMPEQPISYAEAVTIVLRLLDYTTTNLGDNWPYSYMVKAGSLGLTDGINKGAYDTVTRGDVAVIINRALQTELNGSTGSSSGSTGSSSGSTGSSSGSTGSSSGSAKKLITKMDITESSETVIIATKNEDVTLLANQIRTDLGTYELKNTNISVPVLSKVKLILDKDNKVINMVKVYTPTVNSITVDSIVSGGVAYTDGSATGNMNVDDNVTVYKDGKATTYAAVKTEITQGSTLDIYYDQNNNIDYIKFNKAEFTDPVVIRSSIYENMSTVGLSKTELDSAKVIRDGYASNLSEIQPFDVVYYSGITKTLYVYCDKISGVYQEAYPSKAAVSSIKLSEETLDVETQTAAYKLGEKSGSYKLNARITALLGKDGEIVDVVDLNSTDVSTYGVLLSVTDEISSDVDDKGAKITYVNILTGNGNTMKYKTTNDYSEQIGQIKSISFDDNGNVILNKVSYNVVTGTVDKSNKRIGDNWLTNDAKVIEVLTAPDSGEGTATAQVVDFDDIEATELTSRNVIHAVTSGEFGDIALLFVQDVTQSQYKFGVLVKNNSYSNTSTDKYGNITGMSAKGSYEVIVNGVDSTYSTNFSKSVTAGTGIAVLVSNGSLEEINALTKVNSSGKCTALDFSRVKIGNSTYKLASDVQVYEKKDYDYNSVSINDCTVDDMSNAVLYADTTTSGGLIRVIIINKY